MTTPANFEAWAYGQEVECDRDGCDRGVVYSQDQSVLHDPCPTCHGTGEVRGPGLVERVIAAANADQDQRGDHVTRTLADSTLAALRAELGEEG